MSRQRLVRSEIVKKLISGMVLTTAMFAAPKGSKSAPIT